MRGSSPSSGWCRDPVLRQIVVSSDSTDVKTAAPFAQRLDNLTLRRQARTRARVRVRDRPANVGAVRRTTEKPPRPTRPPETGWELGASGLGKAAWVTLAVLLAAFGR